MKTLHVGLTEEMILNYGALPKELHGWRYFRTEYGGHAESCVRETGTLWPPFVNPFVIELLFGYWQMEKTDTN